MKKHMNRKSSRFIVPVLLVCLLMVSTSSFTQAADTFNLKHASWAPKGDTMTIAMTQFMKDLEKKTNGRVKFKAYYAQTLGKLQNSLDMLDASICDTALIPTGLFSKDFPVLDVLSLPGLIQNRTIGTEVMYALYHRGLLKKEFSGYKMIVMQAHDPFYIAFTKKKVNRLEDFKGMKIRYPSVTIKSYFEALGATPVSVPPPELFNAINTGVLDGTAISPGYLIVSKLYEIMKYVSFSNPVSGGANIILMSEKTWNKFPKDIQQIIEELSAKAKYDYLKAGHQQEMDTRKKLKDENVDLYQMSASEVERWYKLAKPVFEQWVSKKEAAGYPGKEALDTARLVVEMTNL